MPISPIDLATYFCVDDIPESISMRDNLHSLLEAIVKNEPLSASRYDTLTSYGLNALKGFIQGNMTLAEFRRLSKEERDKRHSKSRYLRKVVHANPPLVIKPQGYRYYKKPDTEVTGTNPTWEYLLRFRIKTGLADGQSSMSLPPQELAKQFWVDDITSAICSGQLNPDT